MKTDHKSVGSRVTSSERRRGFSLRRQFASLAPLATLWILGITLLFVARFQTAVPLRTLFLDPAYLTGSPWYTGALSNLGIMVWTAGVVFAGAGAWVSRRIGREGAARFLAFGALATLVLALDDVFALHSSVLKELLGGSPAASQIVVVLPVLAWVTLFWADIQRTRSALLFVAFCSLAGSVMVDVAGGAFGGSSLLLEDGLKFLGLLAWSQYFAITSRDVAASAITGALNSADVGSPATDSADELSNGGHSNDGGVEAIRDAA